MNKEKNLVNRYDATLGFSYRYAAELTFNVLSDLGQNEQDKILQDILNIFTKWKFEHGVYSPPQTWHDTLMQARLQQFGELGSVKEELEKQKNATQGSDEKLKTVSAWECAGYANTPLKLFKKLLAEKYEPLRNYVFSGEFVEYEHVLATVVLLNFELNSAQKSVDCIEGALELANMHMRKQKTRIMHMTPDAKETAKKRLNARISQIAKREETERKIMELHEHFQREGHSPPLKEYAAILNISEATISRYLRKNGFRQYK